MRPLLIALALPLAALAADAGPEMEAYFKSLPAVDAPAFTEAQAMALVAMPLSCIDHPQAQSEQRVDYLWVHDGKAHLLDAYDKNRSFYGCYDWHSAVNSTWTMVAVLKQFPAIPVGLLIREKLKNHLANRNVAGEMEFFKSARNFELPYGYAWLLKLYAELLTWDDPDAKGWSQNLAPMAEQFSKKAAEYFKDLPYATRSGLHPNTAFAIALMLDYTAVANDAPLKDVLLSRANRFFLKDRNCPTAYEPGGAEFLSPCLSEARLMAMVLDAAHFARWLSSFLPPAYSAEFQPVTTAVDVKGISKQDLQAGKSHLIGLAFSRGEAMLRIAAALGPADPRAPVYRRLAAISVNSGFQALAEAGYFGSHWLGTYAVMCARARQ